MARKAGVLAARFVQDPSGRPWCFVATDARAIELVPLTRAARPIRPSPHPLQRNVRAVLDIRGMHRNSWRERRWLLVSTDGHISMAQLTWPGRTTNLADSDGTPLRPEIGHIEVGHLRHSPLCIAADRRDNVVRSVLYGSESGLHVAIVDRDGITRERDLLTEGAVQYTRVVKIFEIPYLVAAGAGGRIWSRRWDHPEDTHPSNWLAWPKMRSDAMFMDVSSVRRQIDSRTSAGDGSTARGENAGDESVVFATTLLRTHEIYRVPLYHIDKTKGRLRAGVEELKALPSTDERRYAEITTSPGPVLFDRLKLLAEHGGMRTLEAVVDSLEPSSLTFREALELSLAVVTTAARLGHLEARQIATRLRQRLLTMLRDLPVVSKTKDRSAARDREHLERLALFLRKYFSLAHTFSEKRTCLTQLVQINKKRKNADAFIYASRLSVQGFDVCWETRIRSPILALAAVPSSDRSINEVDRVGLSFADGIIAELTVPLRDPTRSSMPAPQSLGRRPADRNAPDGRHRVSAPPSCRARQSRRAARRT